MTNVQEAFKKAEEENQRTIATYIYKYSDFQAPVAVKELMHLDLFKNNFSKATLNNYLRAINRFLINGEQRKSQAPVYMYKIAQELKDKHYSRLTPPTGCKSDTFNRKQVKEVTIPVSNELTNSSKQSLSNIMSVKNKLELESANTQNSIKKLQEKMSEINSKLNAISVVIDLLK